MVHLFQMTAWAGLTAASICDATVLTTNTHRGGADAGKLTGDM